MFSIIKFGNKRVAKTSNTWLPSFGSCNESHDYNEYRFGDSIRACIVWRVLPGFLFGTERSWKLRFGTKSYLWSEDDRFFPRSINNNVYSHNLFEHRENRSTTAHLYHSTMPATMICPPSEQQNVMLSFLPLPVQDQEQISPARAMNGTLNSDPTRTNRKRQPLLEITNNARCLIHSY